ncbi:MAG TPA: hypothetical protein VGL93_10305 [Streptosporangiaceae bacterium]|jgi:hypothetical protein
MTTVAGTPAPQPDPRPLLTPYETEHGAHLETIARLSTVLGAMRAAVAADNLGHADPLCWVRDALNLEQLLPEPGALPEQVAARPYIPRGML